MKLRIMTFNINRGGTDDKWLEHFKKIVKVSNADIILLQEVKYKYVKDNNNYFNSIFSENWKFIISDYMQPDNEINAEQINVVMYKNHLLLNLLPCNYNFTRKSTLICELQIEKMNITICNLHFIPENNKGWQNKDLNTLNKMLDSFNSNFIIAGDFNIRYKKLLKSINSRYLIDSNNGAWYTTVTRDENKVTLSKDFDHFIYSSNSFNNIKIERLLLKDNKYVISFDDEKYFTSKNYKYHISDHLPLLMEFSILEEKTK